MFVCACIVRIDHLYVCVHVYRLEHFALLCPSRDPSDRLVSLRSFLMAATTPRKSSEAASSSGSGDPSPITEPSKGKFEGVVHSYEHVASELRRALKHARTHRYDPSSRYVQVLDNAELLRDSVCAILTPIRSGSASEPDDEPQAGAERSIHARWSDDPEEEEDADPSRPSPESPAFRVDIEPSPTDVDEPSEVPAKARPRAMLVPAKPRPIIPRGSVTRSLPSSSSSLSEGPLPWHVPMTIDHRIITIPGRSGPAAPAFDPGPFYVPGFLDKFGKGKDANPRTDPSKGKAKRKDDPSKGKGVSSKGKGDPSKGKGKDLPEGDFWALRVEPWAAPDDTWKGHHAFEEKYGDGPSWSSNRFAAGYKIHLKNLPIGCAANESIILDWMRESKRSMRWDFGEPIHMSCFLSEQKVSAQAILTFRTASDAACFFQLAWPWKVTSPSGESQNVLVSWFNF